MASLLPGSAFVILACAALALAPAQAATYTISGPSMGAAGIRSDNEAEAGSALQLIVGQFAGGDRRGRALFSFDLSAIPAGSIIESVSLRLTLDSADTGSTAGSVALELYQLTGGSFAESNVTWNKRATDANWSTPGGDFNPTLLSSALADPTGPIGAQIQFGTSPGFVNAVASNVGGTVSFLVKLNAADEANASVRRTFFFASDDSSNQTRIPVFTVEYSIPEPGSSVLLLVGAALVHTVRWRRR